MTEDTFFSVIIPLYNKEEYIFRSLDSVMSQTYKKFEIIVIDDGSTDDGPRIVEGFDDPRVKLIKQPNKGVAVARNQGIDLARFNWIALLDADDEWDDSFLEKIYQAICENPRCIAYSAATKKYCYDGSLVNSKLKREGSVKSGVINNFFKDFFFSSTPLITSSSVCLNKKLLKQACELPLFPKSVKRGEDLDAWVRLALKGDIYFINQPLVIIHSVPGNTGCSFNYDETFPYGRWYTYKGRTYSDTFYLKLTAVKKRLQIIKKLLLHRQYNVIPRVIFDMITPDE